MKKPIRRNLKDIAIIERAVKGKLYPKGSPLIALSASMEANKGGITNLKEEGEVESRWAVILPLDNNVNPLYLYYVMLNEYDEFYQKHNTGINLQIGELDYFIIWIHEEEQDRLDVMNAMKLLDEEEEVEEQMVDELKKMKKYLVSQMLI